MRFLLKVSIPTEAGNKMIADPKFGKTMQQILKEIKAEAAYFAAEDGKRGAYIVVNMDDASKIPSIAEPFFLYMNATVEFIPVMTPEDLAKAGPDIAKALKRYSKG